MKILVMGTGFVGLTHAAVCSEYGHIVYAYDIDKKKIEDFSSGKSDLIEAYVNEPGLSEIVRDTAGKSLFFSSNLQEAAKDADAIFLCLPTPPNLNGSTDLSYYDSALEKLSAVLKDREGNRRIVFHKQKHSSYWYCTASGKTACKVWGFKFWSCL